MVVRKTYLRNLGHKLTQINTPSSNELAFQDYEFRDNLGVDVNREFLSYQVKVVMTSTNSSLNHHYLGT